MSEAALAVLRGRTHFEDYLGNVVTPETLEPAWWAPTVRSHPRTMDYADYHRLRDKEDVRFEDEIAFEVYDDDA